MEHYNWNTIDRLWLIVLLINWSLINIHRSDRSQKTLNNWFSFVCGLIAFAWFSSTCIQYSVMLNCLALKMLKLFIKITIIPQLTDWIKINKLSSNNWFSFVSVNVLTAIVKSHRRHPVFDRLFRYQSFPSYYVRNQF